jgi:hypothetical protein
MSEQSVEFDGTSSQSLSSSEQKEQSTHSNFFYQIWARFLLWLRRVFGGKSASSKTT